MLYDISVRNTFFAKEEIIMSVYIWVAAAIVFAVVEAATAGLVSVWFIGGAVAALIASLAGASVALQIVLFFLVSAALLAAIRPLTRRYIAPKKSSTNADRLIGREVLVCETIDPLHERGAIRTDGVVWSARTADHTVIDEGTVVRITKIEGSKVTVEPVAVCAAEK